MEPTYTITQNPPPEMSWDNYEKYLSKEWNELLNDSKKQGEEPLFQDFLERHPCLLPEPYTCFGRGAHNPMLSAAFSQPELPGARALRPDFMWIARDSGMILAVLIEIEAPIKRWSNKDGTPTADFVHAQDQLRQWKTWFSEPSNIMQFRDLYRIDSEDLRSRQFAQKYILIYGRRAELEGNPAYSKKRETLAGPDELLMSFDRLRPNANFRHIVTARLDRSTINTGFELMHLPPTFRLGPRDAPDFSRLKNREAAINANNLISDERKRFLISRLAYWDTWANRPRSNSNRFEVIQTGDFE